MSKAMSRDLKERVQRDIEAFMRERHAYREKERPRMVSVSNSERSVWVKALGRGNYKPMCITVWSTQDLPIGVSLSISNQRFITCAPPVVKA